MRIPKTMFATFLGAGLVLMGSARPAAGQADDGAKKALVLPHVLEAIETAIGQPLPDGLSPADQRKYGAETEWLKTVRNRVEALGIEGGVIKPRDTSTGLSTGRRQHNPIRFTMQLGRLQQTIETESQQFSAVTGAAKARHDVAMNAIRNMKG